MKDIAIYGAGGLGREVASLLLQINALQPTWNIVGFFDDGKTIGENVSHFGKVLGGIDEVNNWPSPLNLVLGFGAPKTLSAIRHKITNPLISFPNIIDPTFIVSDPSTFEIGEGNIITRGCGVTTNVHIGSFNLFNGENGVGHDTRIGNFNVFMPMVKISGEVLIGDCNLFGTGSFVKQQLKIGNNVTLSPLSALLTKPKDNNVYIGNPAKLFRF